MSTEMTPEVFTADYVGEPGHRTFYLQARDANRSITYLVEKQQVSLLAEKFRELLMMVDSKDTIRNTQAARDPALALEAPLESQTRIGTIALAYEEDRDRVVVLMQEATEAETEEAESDDSEAVRFILRRDQVRAFVLHALASTAEGRPICQLCGLPMDPEGHACPASNGHRAEV